ncbi:tyrosine-type recombinase/integrase [Arthrobacter sp. H35-D1]|uniref:tyrosine-type recombinase/integrase n=1 Tax=Arthrobacter sp. H35-D1 TaxID=3046202 RepID=UPI0024B98C7D|nr:tyrosine-type recombinase/integrase [Arthrobacter sp. H35-D1]MDJ0315074.1 tyrosine-type recombinase/integrase [Arthrobacter sp. H35-D1]
MASVVSYETKTQGKLWMVRYRTPDRVQTMQRGFKTKRDALLWLSNMEVAKSRGEYIGNAAGKIGFAEWAEVWFDAQVHLKPTTRSNYRQCLDKHVIARWGERQIGSITHGEVQAWIKLLAQTMTPSSLRIQYQTLSAVLKHAVRDGRLVKNACDGVKLPKIVKRKHGYLTHEQVAALAEECKDYGDVVLFLSYTGLRYGEMAALRVGRLNMLRRRIDVAEAVADVRGTLEWGTPKSHEARSVPFPKFLAESLARRCDGKGRDDLVFTGARGSVLRGNNFRKRVFNDAVEKLIDADPDFPLITPHDLRHTAASLAISAHANVKSIQRMLGHADAAMTLNTYADLFEDDLDAVADALDAAYKKIL